MYVSIGQASELIGVSISTMRRWESENRFQPSFRTKGGHRRYSLKEIKAEFYGEIQDENDKLTVAYARVSSSDQKDDLRRQEKSLLKYCRRRKWKTILISDLGSGINYRKRGLNKLLAMMCKESISRLVLTHNDRLLRFGSPLIFKICQQFQIEIVVINQPNSQSFEEELVRDVLEIMTVYSAKLYGRRSHLNRKKAA